MNNMQSKLPVFFCYRRVDGKEVARWLFDKLENCSVPQLGDTRESTDVEEQPRLRIYWDEETPPGQTWEHMHDDALRSSLALILISSPGACSRKREDDWVYKEIEWWAQNRSTAPVIVETTGKGAPWIPEAVVNRWPGTQWITLLRDSVEKDQINERDMEVICRRILTGIALGERTVRNEQIVELDRLNAKNKSLITKLQFGIVELDRLDAKNKSLITRLQFGIAAALFFGFVALCLFDYSRQETKRADTALQVAENNEQLRKAALSSRLAVEDGKGTQSLVEGIRAVVPQIVAGRDVFPDAQRALIDAVTVARRSFALVGHKTGLTHFAISPDGTRVATASKDKLVKLWGITQGNLIRTFDAEQEPHFVDFSPDGTRLVATCFNNAKVWRVDDGELLGKLEHDARLVNQVRFVSDGKPILTVSYDGQVCKWKTPSLEKDAQYSLGQECESVAVSPDGTRISGIVESSPGDYSFLLWNVTTQAKIREVHHGKGFASDPIFSPDSKYLLTLRGQSPPQLWSADDGSAIGSLEDIDLAASKRIIDGGLAIFDKSSQYVIRACDDTASVWKVEDRRLCALMKGHLGQITSLDTSLDANYLLTASTDRTARVWRLNTGHPIFRHDLKGHLDTVVRASYGKTDDCIVTASADGTARVWHPLADVSVAVLQNAELSGDCIYAAISPDGHKIISVYSSGHVGFWDVSSRQLLKTLKLPDLPIGSPMLGNVVAWFDGVDSFMVADVKGNLNHAKFEDMTFQDVSTIVADFRCVGESHYRVDVSPDGLALFAARRGHGQYWDLTDHSFAYIAPKPDRYALGKLAAFIASRNTRTAVLAPRDSDDVTLLEIDSGEEIATLDAGIVKCMAVSRQGDLFATGSVDRTCRVWKASSGELIAVLTGHEEQITCLAFTSDGKRIATGSQDSTVRLWDVSTGDCLCVYRGHLEPSEVMSVQCDTENRYVVSSSSDGTVRLFPMRPDDIARIALKLMAHRPEVSEIELEKKAFDVWSKSH